MRDIKTKKELEEEIRQLVESFYKNTGIMLTGIHIGVGADQSLNDLYVQNIQIFEI